MPELPCEVWNLIYRHQAATVLQRRWLRYSLLSHSRQKTWHAIRHHLKSKHVWPALICYSLVRREWRTEAASWLNCQDIEIIKKEAEDGWWGVRSPRLPSDCFVTHPLCP